MRPPLDQFHYPFACNIPVNERRYRPKGDYDKDWGPQDQGCVAVNGYFGRSLGIGQFSLHVVES